MSGSSAHCHKLIAKVAKGIAAANYEELMRDDLVYRTWQKSNPGVSKARLQQAFVNRKWGLYVQAARTTLGLLLRQPIDERLKEEIMEALVLDSTLIRGRQNPARVVGQLPAEN